MALRFKVLVCRGPTCGPVCRSDLLRQCLDRSLAESGLDGEVEVGWQSCFGRCTQAPNLLVRDLGAAAPAQPSFGLATMPVGKGRSALYSRLDESGIVRIVREHLRGGRVVRELLSAKPESSGAAVSASEPRQHRLPQVLASLRGGSEGENNG